MLSGLERDDLREEFLRLGIAPRGGLPLRLLRQCVERFQVFRIGCDGLLKMRKGFRKFAPLAFDQAQQLFDTAVAGQQRTSLLGIPVSRIEILLAKREQCEIRPTRRLTRGELRGPREALFRGIVRAGLESGKANIERTHQIGILW